MLKVEQTGTFVTDKVTYSVMTGTDGWKALPGVDGVYYREVGAVTTDTDFYVLTGNTAHPNGVVIVSDKLTKAEIDTITRRKSTQADLHGLRCAEGRY